MNRHSLPVRSLVAPVALLLAASFALAGCGQGTDQTGSAKDGPITSRLKTLYGEDRWRAENDRYEEVVATCMKEKGFEYTPVQIDEDGFSVTLDDEDWDPVADAKEDGYHITPASKDALIEKYGLGGSTETVDEDPDFLPDDLNRPYYDSLSPSDQAAYDEALYGPGSEADMTEEYDWKSAGCYGEAFHQVYEGQTEALDATVMDDFSAYVDEMVENDSRVREGTTAWTACMAGKQYTFASSEEAQESIQARFDALTGSDSTLDEWVPPNPDLFSDAEIAALHDDEIATATADAECVEEAKLNDLYSEILFEAETKFYNTHKAEVDAWFEAQEAKS